MTHRLLVLMLVMVGVAACGSEPTPAPPEDFITPTVVAERPSPTPEPTPTLTPIPTEVPRDFTTYTHPTGVFTMTLPNDWEPVDLSTEQRLRVQLLPPVGYGSRITIDVTNEGPLEPNEVRAEFDSALRLLLEGQAAYTQLTREANEANTVYEAIYSYDDGRGGQGTERIVGQQIGPYFTLLRLFTAEEDIYTLNSAMETMANGLAVNTEARWGSPVAAINPAELPIVDARLWRDEEGITYWGGQVQNNAPVTVSNVQVTAAICDENEIVVAELTEVIDINRVGRGAAVPFGFAFEDLGDETEVCAQSATGVPAQPDPTTTNTLRVETTADTASGIEILIQGTITNETLSPVTDIELMIALFDEEGTVVGYRLVSFGFSEVLLPGQSIEFRETFEELAGEAFSYVVYNEADVLRSSNPALSP